MTEAQALAPPPAESRLRPLPVAGTGSVDPARRRKAKLLSTLLVVMAVVFATADLASWLTRPGYLPPWYGYLLLLAAWLLNRSGRYLLAAGLTVAAFPIATFWQAASQVGADARDTLSYLVIGVLLTSILLSARGIVFFSGICLLGLALLPWVAPVAVPSAADIVSPLALVTIAAALAVVSIVHRDQIERDRQAALRESEERLRLALDAARMQTWELDIPSGALRWSRAASSSLDPPGIALVASFAQYVERVHADDRAAIEAAFRRAQDPTGDGLLDVEHRITTRDGQERWLYVRSQTYFEGEGPAREAVRAVGGVIDVTDRQRAREERLSLEQQLLQAQKMEAVGRLAGGVAHDFNNLLMVIINYCILVLRDGTLGARLRHHVETVRDAGESAANLTRQLLAFSRKQVLQPVVLDLNVLVARMENMLRRIIGEDVDLATRLGTGLWPILADPGQMEQVIVNLAVNSRDAMPGGGRLTIETGNTFLDEEYARRHPETRPGEYILLAVTDDGVGMDPGTLSRIFEPFFSTKGHRGTGLGLSTVQGIVRQSGGHVWPYSEPGRGTTFKVYLPRCTSGEAVPESRPAPIPAMSKGETVLVVEDSPEVRTLVVDLLTDRGHCVLQAGSPDDAMEIAARHRGAIDLLITDVVMPRMSGHQMAEQLVARRPGLAVLYMSGYTEDAIVHQGVLDPGVDFIAKPFTLDSLARKVEEVLLRRRAG
jgi:signal transduction histidine kinase/ActR/RegA family two-component response regulator